jgi:hypothetical protein
MKAALKKGVDSGMLVMVKSSYKVSPEAKKPVKAKKPTVAKVKKPVTKKVNAVIVSVIFTFCRYHPQSHFCSLFPAAT